MASKRENGTEHYNAKQQYSFDTLLLSHAQANRDPQATDSGEEREMLNISRDWHASLISRPGDWERDGKSRDPLHSATDDQKLNAVTIQISEEVVKTPI